jgi:hypothetical protein
MKHKRSRTKRFTGVELDEFQALCKESWDAALVGVELDEFQALCKESWDAALVGMSLSEYWPLSARAKRKLKQKQLNTIKPTL